MEKKREDVDERERELYIKEMNFIVRPMFLASTRTYVCNVLRFATASFEPKDLTSS
jgi:hypothetical protein